MTTETSDNTPDPAANTSAASAETHSVEVELEYKHDHHIPGSSEYPVDEALHLKIEEHLVAVGFWRLYIMRKSPDPVTVNCVTLKGIKRHTDIVSNLDAEELERAVLSVCHRDASKVGRRCSYLIRLCRKMPPGQRAKKAEVTLDVTPIPGGYAANTSPSDDRPSDPGETPPQERWSQRVQEWESGAPPHPSSPLHDQSPFAHPRPWRENFEQPARRYDPNDEESRNYQLALQQRRRHMFTPDMGFSPERLSPDAQKMYTESIVPFAVVNSAAALSYQAAAAALDIMSTANHETSRLHSLQVAQMLDERSQLMTLIMRQHEIDGQNRGYHAQQLKEGHQAYVEALRMRGEMTSRELTYERQQMYSQYQLGESQRALVDQEEKHRRDQSNTLRQELVRNIGPMMLRGVGLFLEYFGQQKMGQGAKAAGTLVGGLMDSISRPQQGPPGANPGPAHGGPAPDPSPRRSVVDVRGQSGPSIPRRSIRVRDVATDEEIATQPLRSLCRMVDKAFLADDRDRMRSVMLPEEWGALEETLRASTDQECIGGLASVMLSLARDEQRKNAMLAALTPGQNALFEKIGSFINGQGTLDPTYEVEMGPLVSRMRPVSSAEGARTVPIPPPDLDAPRPSARTVPVPPGDIPRPVSRASTPRVVDTVGEDVPQAAPRATAPEVGTGDGGVSPSPSPEQAIQQALTAMAARLEQVQQENVQMAAALRAELADLRGGTKVVQGPDEGPVEPTEVANVATPRKRGGRPRKAPKTD